MENEFYTDNFEHNLRETTDQFRMYPSRRVWHSLYNDLHPGKKWPSGAVLLLLITSIMYIGVSNTKDNVNTVKITGLAGLQSVSDISENNSLPPANKLNVVFKNETGNSADQIPTESSEVLLEHGNISNVKNKQNHGKSGNSTFSTMTSSVTSNVPTVNKNSFAKVIDIRSASSITSSVIENASLFIETGDDEYKVSSEETAANADIIILTSNSDIKVNESTSAKSLELQSWMDDFIFHNKKQRKSKGRLAYQVYATPSSGFRTFYKNTDYNPPVTNSLVAVDPQSNHEENYLNHSNALNLEAGGNILYNFSKRIRLKAGLQVNYTNYYIDAYELNHPTSTYILTNNLETGGHLLDSRQTTLANTPGLSSKNLNNNTYQFSVPLGAEFKVAGGEKFKWYAGATVQPTYVAGGNSYLISSDLKNYVTGNDLRRKFNLNGAVETYISYKTNSGITLNAGPQFRYQFLSTYSKAYSYNEKLFNLGLKVGITQHF